MTILDALRSILIEQIEGYRTLLDLLQRERGALTHLNASGVEDLSKEKDLMVLRLRLLEEERLRLVKKFSDERMLKGDVTLRKLAELTGDESFLPLRLQLISLLQSIKELNDFNRILIERSLGFIKNSISFLDASGLSIKKSRNYPGALLSREV